MSNIKILVVDDSPEICRFIDESVLTPAGYIVHSVGDGMSAFTLARETEPNLVIADNQMPGMTGIDLIRRLHQERPHLPVILMTADGSESLAMDALRAGAVDYLTKPFEADLLLAAGGRALAEGRRWQSTIQAQSEALANAETLARPRQGDRRSGRR